MRRSFPAAGQPKKHRPCAGFLFRIPVLLLSAGNHSHLFSSLLFACSLLYQTFQKIQPLFGNSHDVLKILLGLPTVRLGPYSSLLHHLDSMIDGIQKQTHILDKKARFRFSFGRCRVFLHQYLSRTVIFFRITVCSSFSRISASSTRSSALACRSERP